MNVLTTLIEGLERYGRSAAKRSYVIRLRSLKGNISGSKLSIAVRGSGQFVDICKESFDHAHCFEAHVDCEAEGCLIIIF
jgi:hypothetical protein